MQLLLLLLQNEYQGVVAFVVVIERGPGVVAVVVAIERGPGVVAVGVADRERGPVVVAIELQKEFN